MNLTKKTAYTVILSSAFLLIVSYVFQPLTYLGFARPDDHWMLLKNEFVHPSKFDLSYLKEVFTHVNQIQYSPINTLYYSLVFQINGYDPYYYHICNLLIHFINSALIFKLVKNILSMFNMENSALIAYVVSLLWSIHPLNVEPVTWVSGSKILLCTLFTLCATLCFIKLLVLEKAVYYFGAAFCFAISFLCKELAILTPIMFCLLSYCYYNGRIHRLPRMQLLFLTAMIAASIVLGIYTAHINKMETQEFAPIAGYSVGKRVLLIFYCIGFYLGNLLTPVNLHYHYAFPIQPDGPIARYMYLPSFTLLLSGVHIASSKFAFNHQVKPGKLICVLLLALYIYYYAGYSHQLVLNWLSLDLR